MPLASAWLRRGRKFGTILVDLNTHLVIDLLPERKVESAVTWMQSHPEIQSADRFHLMVRRIGAYSIPFGERRG